MLPNAIGRPPLDRRLVQANELGIRLEVVGGLPLWEFSPARRHQQLVLHVRRDRVARHTSPMTIELECGCHCSV